MKIMSYESLPTALSSFLFSGKGGPVAPSDADTLIQTRACADAAGRTSAAGGGVAEVCVPCHSFMVCCVCVCGRYDVLT